MKKPTKAQIKRRGRIMMIAVGIASVCFPFWISYMSDEHLPFWILVVTALIGCPASVLCVWIGVKLAEVIFTAPSETAEEAIRDGTSKK